MKKIGLIGGMSDKSTIHYYDGLGEDMRARLGGHNNGRVVMSSLNFQDIVDGQKGGAWEEMGVALAQEAKNLQDIGADFIVIATNTMHKCAPQVEAAITIPLLHIGDATAKRVLRAGFNKVALLGTRFTMEEDFYKRRLETEGIEALIPDAQGVEDVDRIIFDELCHGTIKPESKARYLEIIRDLQARGAQGVILGCTEIGMLIGQGDVDIPVFDTTKIHIEEAVDMALEA